MSDGNVQIHEIDGAKYTVIKLPAKTAWLLKLRIGNILGPRLQDLVKLAAMEAKKKQAAVGVEDETAVAEELKNDTLIAAVDIFGKFIGELKPEEGVDLLVTLCSHAKKNGDQITPDNFNEAFADNSMTALKVAMRVFQHNFTGFSGAVAKSNFGQKMSSMVKTF